MKFLSIVIFNVRDLNNDCEKENLIIDIFRYKMRYKMYARSKDQRRLICDK